uniref:Caffeoyl-CoA O-methyltransferase n=1 Tax=Candidatus Kentrum sp. FM TaxID=2126340 RepID=A0A450T673_9GAMM|nr:MAG: caffeoyl-CoA O-methyltransferase [Candidatus Kentron sp. FM]VFJ73118.1 MAG: caffeoyl-CoA O-methyltransferase [Candidatus Kentron sp. FM]VFK19912.1 MAG: caffeoyl-CoA O-methyltransferase [Candidatus Kentron sp. FM]
MKKSPTPLVMGIDNIRDARDHLEKRDLGEAARLIEAALERLAGIDEAVSSNTSPASDHLAAIEKRTMELDWPRLYREGKTERELEAGMLLENPGVQLLKMIIGMAGYKKVLEIGSFTGYATLGMAEALPGDGEIVSCEIEPYAADMARSFFRHTPHDKKITIRAGSALESMKALSDEGRRFELIFIDANKLEYRDYLNAILDFSLLFPQGCIVVDNTLYRGEIYLPPEKRSVLGEAVEQFNRMVADHPGLTHVMLPLRDGMTLIRLR